MGLSVGERQWAGGGAGGEVGGQVGRGGGGVSHAPFPQLLQVQVRWEVRWDGGCRGREGTGRHNATVATAPPPPWSSLPALRRKDKGHCAV